MQGRYKIGARFYPNKQTTFSLEDISDSFLNRGFSMIYNEDDLVIIQKNNIEFKLERNGSLSIFKRFNNITPETLSDLYSEGTNFIADFKRDNRLSINFCNEINFIFSGKDIRQIIERNKELFTQIGLNISSSTEKKIYYYDDNFLLTTIRSSRSLSI